MAMGKIFVNYRQSQGQGYPADVIAQVLEDEFGEDRVFLDIDDVKPSDDFAAKIETELPVAKALVVLIGAGWHKVQDERSGRRRLDAEDDWVRHEIRTSLERQIPIFPVLMDDAQLPEADHLPPDIRGLLRQQGTHVRRATLKNDLNPVLTILAEKTGLPRAMGGQLAPSPARARLATPSRAPIVIAIEAASARIPEQHLLAVERHLTVTLSDDDLGRLRSIQDRIDSAPSVAALVDLGAGAWSILSSAAPRLDGLVQRVAAAEEKEGFPQPVAWIGTFELLSEIHRAILLACRDAGARVPFLTVSYGAHYFHPLSDDGRPRRMQRRSGDSRSKVRIARLESTEIGAAFDNEVIVLSSDDLASAMQRLVDEIPRQPSSPTRIVLGFGDTASAAPIVPPALAAFPCVALGGPALHRDPAIFERLQRALSTDLRTQAVSVVVAQERAEAVADQLAHKGAEFDVLALRDALGWTTWSWVGRPLFADGFGEVLKGAYPHLMDLRDVASRDWYYERDADIPAPYRTSALAAKKLERMFHLYVSGGGGTGKSCFLRSIYDTLGIEAKNVLAVWYKVHAPSSEWSEVEAQLKIEVRAALARYGNGADRLLTPADDRKQLGTFLLDLREALRARNHAIDQIAIFIDQLERTFESGENPELAKLTKISQHVVALLEKVGIDQGIRIFIASRKQYLADFLSSFYAASTIHLHFNVLQALSVDVEGVAFVQRIAGWFNSTKLASSDITIDDGAAQLLALKERGHPLNLMLGLIDLLSRPDLPAEITRDTIEELRPWERRFHVDEALMGKDDLGWYFFLAMAHAQTEIVRREEVMWRLALVNRDLARQINELTAQGVLERLWLVGHLGRTMHPRRQGADSSRFLEFFHANLRDHLISNVMNRAEDASGADGTVAALRRRGMPAAWRALDRLREIARDWEQVQQALVRDDIAVLMDHKDAFTKLIKKPGGKAEVESFYLLFMRDVDDRRDENFRAARECVAYSAIVHDVHGRSVFKTLFPAVSRDPRGIEQALDDTQVGCCRRWLRARRADSQALFRILHYLVELRDPYANRLLAELVFDTGADDEPWHRLASILADPVVAATHRSAFLVSTIQYLLDANVRLSDDNRYTDRFGAFLVAASDGQGNELNRVLETVAGEARLVADARLSAALREVEHPDRVSRWLGASGVAGARSEFGSSEGPVVELRMGETLAAHIDPSRLDAWAADVGSRLGIPLPSFAHSLGEVSKYRVSDEAVRPLPPGNELELIVRGRLIGLSRFYPDRIQTLTRDWDGAESRGAIPSFNDALAEPVRWVEPNEINTTTWRGRRWTFEEAAVDWLHGLLRRHASMVFSYEDVHTYLSGVARAAGARFVMDLPSLSNLFYLVREVITQLVRERVPVAQRNIDLLRKLLEIVRESESFDVTLTTRLLREHVQADLCRGLADDTNQLIVMLLDPTDEQWLRGRLARSAIRLFFDKLSPEEARRIAAAVRERVEEVTRADRVVPVLVCADHLRQAMFDLLQRYDPRIFVLSYSELSPDVRMTWRGVVRRFSPLEAAT